MAKAPWLTVSRLQWLRKLVRRADQGKQSTRDSRPLTWPEASALTDGQAGKANATNSGQNVRARVYTVFWPGADEPQAAFAGG